MDIQNSKIPNDYSENVVSVSEYLELLNEFIKPLNFSVMGEVSSVSDRAGNAIFFSVSDEKEQAKLECVIWRYQYNLLGLTLKPGEKIKMCGYPNIYKPAGKFTYIATNIIPTGEGELQKAFEELKNKLSREGLFSPQRKRPLPAYIKTIGLITADNSDAKKDFETHLGKFGYKIYFYDVHVEGLKSAENIAKAIQYFNENSFFPNEAPEILVVTRGGGSLESLQAFNSEIVARAVFSSKIPVLSAIGHENNFTICDMVADIRGSTPTDAGKIISQDWRETSLFLSSVWESMSKSYKTMLASHWEYLRLQSEKISGSFSASVHSEQNRIINLKTTILREMEHVLRQNQQKLEYLQKILDSLNPEKKLLQGYAIVRNEAGKIIKSSKSLKPNDIMETQFFDGKVISRVER